MYIARFIARLMLLCVLLCLLSALAMQALGKTQAGGSAIVFASRNSQPRGIIELISFNSFPGTPIWQETLFSQGTRYFAESPDCSPDGQQIVFSSNHLGSVGGFSFPDAHEGYHIYILNLNTRFTEALTDQPDSYNFQPLWSPDANTILFTHSADIGERPDLYTIDITTRQMTHLNLNADVSYQSFDWSLDGSQIIYSAWLPANSNSKSTQLYTLNPAGGEPIPLASDDETSFANPDWSPDGTKIALSVYTSPNGSRFYSVGIYIMNADGSNLIQLTTMESYSPAFSPDGQMIAFAAWVNDQSDIYVMNADGSRLRQITNTPYEDEGSPCWLP